jgi:hypothetical protein
MDENVSEIVNVNGLIINIFKEKRKHEEKDTGF